MKTWLVVFLMGICLHIHAQTVEDILDPKKGPFEVLGLKPGASEAEIRQARKKLAREFHPDQNNNSDLYTRATSRINEAVDYLLGKSKSFEGHAPSTRSGDFRNTGTPFTQPMPPKLTPEEELHQELRSFEEDRFKIKYGPLWKKYVALKHGENWQYNLNQKYGYQKWYLYQHEEELMKGFWLWKHSFEGRKAQQEYDDAVHRRDYGPRSAQCRAVMRSILNYGAMAAAVGLPSLIGYSAYKTEQFKKENKNIENIAGNVGKAPTLEELRKILASVPSFREKRELYVVISLRFPNIELPSLAEVLTGSH